MFLFECAFVIAAVLQVISANDFPPPRCTGPPPLNGKKPHECCKAPRFFQDEEFVECGFPKPDSEDGNFRSPPPSPDVMCSKQLCLLKKHDLIDDKEEIDLDATGKFIDKWAEGSSDLKPIADEAKKRCLSKNLPGPPHACQADRMMFCFIHTVTENCPKWEEDDECKKVKEFIDSCKPNAQ